MICHPFKAEKFCSVSRARKVVLCLYLFGILFNLPKFFEYKTVVTSIPFLNKTQVNCDLTSFGMSTAFRELYHSWFYITFVCAVPFIALAVLNISLIKAVHLSRKKGREINAAEKKRNDTTIMLISVVVVFFVCQTPALVCRTTWAFVSEAMTFKQMPLYTLNEIGNFLVILNSAINIVPYYFFGRRFRRQFWHLLCHCIHESDHFISFMHSTNLTNYYESRKSNFMHSDAENFNLHLYNKRNSIHQQKALVLASTKQVKVICTNVAPEDDKGTPKTRFNGDLSYEPVQLLTSTLSTEHTGTCLIHHNLSPSTEHPHSISSSQSEGTAL